MGIFTLMLLIAMEAFFLVWSIRTRSSHNLEKAVVSITALVLFVLLVAAGVYDWSFRYGMFLIVLVTQAAVAGVALYRKKETQYRLKRSITRFIRNSFIFAFALFLAILLPQYEPVKITGQYGIETAKYTWTDTARQDPFSKTGENRAVTVELWYPKNPSGSYPLVVFSHGAFGFSGSNYSTFAELASNGYVVASIGHTSHAFYTMDTRGKLTLADQGFLNKVGQINAVHDASRAEEVYNISREWLKLRTEDEHFVIDQIMKEKSSPKSDPIFSMIDTEKIGLMGHSLGGASSAQLGRDRTDIDAVIVLDGTMLGEEVAFQNGAAVLNEKPYPVPILNIYAEDHYTSAKTLEAENYSNFHARKTAVSAYETVFQGAGHLNFTDLPLFSPILARSLGVGTCDERQTIETMNQVVLEFFNSCLKEDRTPRIAKEY